MIRKFGLTAGLWGGFALVALLTMACSSSSNSSSKTPTAAAATTAPTTRPAAVATTAAPTAASGPATVKIGDSSLGKVLTDSNGLTLYVYTRDAAGSGKSAVSGPLATAWPAFTLSSGNPVKPDGLTGDLAIITRDDGSKHVTYKGLPLYHWAQDKAPGDVTGQNIAGFVVAAP